MTTMYGKATFPAKVPSPYTPHSSQILERDRNQLIAKKMLEIKESDTSYYSQAIVDEF